MLKYLVLIALFLPFSEAHAHCEIPCGIYDDARMFDEIEQHITTIEKSINSIVKSENTHDITRWTINKEEHAQKIQDIASSYFLTQRLKVNAPQYMQQLLRLHLILTTSMKTKQTTDLSNVKNLRANVKAFEKLYFTPHEHKEKPSAPEAKK